MKVESHLENLKESINEIDEAVKTGLIKKQRTLGFHASAGAIDMLEIILHKKDLIDPGFVVKHEWLNSQRKIKDKLNMEFPKKDEILAIIQKIEGLRSKLCYGKRQEEDMLEHLVSDFNSLKKLFQEVAGYEV